MILSLVLFNNDHLCELVAAGIVIEGLVAASDGHVINLSEKKLFPTKFMKKKILKLQKKLREY